MKGALTLTDEEVQALRHHIEHMQTLDYKSKIQAAEPATRDRVLGWVSDYEFKARHIDIQSTKMPGSCQWLIQSPKFFAWRESIHGLFVLRGMRMSHVYSKATTSLISCCSREWQICTCVSACAFKDSSSNIVSSCYSSSAIDDIQTRVDTKPKHGIAYFYIVYLEADDGILGQLVSSLLRQLLQQIQGLPASIVKASDRLGRHGKRLTYEEACEELLLVVTVYRRVYICIDAFDELDKDQQKNLLELVDKLTSTTKVRLFISSRSIRRIDDFIYQNQHLEYSFYQRQIHEEDVRSDIIDLVLARVGSIGHLRSQNGLQTKIAHEVVSRSQGM